MLKIIKYSYILLVITLLGCANYPENLGFSYSEWQNFTPSQQEAIISNSKKIEHQSSTMLRQGKGATATSFLEIKVHDGQVMMPPFNDWVAYKPVTYKIAKNECRDVDLVEKDGDNKIALRSCFKNNILFIDPSRYDMTKKMGSINIYASPLWEQGFTYRSINTTGYARLKNATLEVKEHLAS